jgi:hypothetical protein
MCRWRSGDELQADAISRNPADEDPYAYPCGTVSPHTAAAHGVTGRRIRRIRDDLNWPAPACENARTGLSKWARRANLAQARHPPTYPERKPSRLTGRQQVGDNGQSIRDGWRYSGRVTMKHVIGWVVLGGVLGAASPIDPLGLLLAVIVLGILIGAKMRTTAPGLALVGAGVGATVVLLVVERTFPDTVSVGVPLTLGVVLAGGLWAYVIRRQGHSLAKAPGRPKES